MHTGLGIRPELFEDMFCHSPELGFLEAHSENYFDTSIARSKLLELRQDYPISLHGVGLSLGRADALDQAHLAQLKTLVDDVDPLFVSEHLAWSAYAHTHLPDLLPLPLTEQAFQAICAHIVQMQDTLGRQVLIENPSNYLVFDQLQITEPEFLNYLCQQTGCGLLLDVNNVFVSASNLDRDANQYLNSIRPQNVKQYHLAGHTPLTVNDEPILIDTHNQPVCDQVWALYQNALEHIGHRPTLIEWDSDFPEFDVLLNECAKAEQIYLNVKTQTSEPSEASAAPHWKKQTGLSLEETQTTFLEEVLSQRPDSQLTDASHKKRIWVYQNNSYGALKEYLEEVFPATRGVVGADYFTQLCQQCIQTSPPKTGNIYLYGGELLNQAKHLTELPYLPDLVHFEWANHCAYFADESEPLDPSAFDHETDLLEHPVQLNPSVWVYKSKYPIYEIYRQSLPGYTDQVNIDLGQSEDSLLVFKHQQSVHHQVLESPLFELLKCIEENGTLLKAINSLSGSIAPQLLSQALAFVIQQGLLTKK